MKHQARLVSQNAQRVLEEECSAFTAYLVGAAPSPYVKEQYTKAACAHGLAFDEDFCCFDRATLILARKGCMLARWADAYCALFHRNGSLRRKLIVLAAILEHVPPTNQAFDTVEPRHVVVASLSLAAYGCMSAVSLLGGVLVLLPASMLCWIATRSGSSMRAR